MAEKTALDWIAIVLVIVGGLNWGLYAINTGYDLVALIFQGYNVMSRIVYGLVGLAAIYMIYMAMAKK